MEDKEIKEPIKDLESVGLSDNPSIIEVGKDGVLEIRDEKNDEEVFYNRIYLLKTAEYSCIKEFEDFKGKQIIVLRFYSSDAWYIMVNTKENMRKVSEKIQRFINS